MPELDKGVYFFPEGRMVPIVGIGLESPRFSHRLPYGGALPDNVVMMSHPGVARLKRETMLEIRGLNASFVSYSDPFKTTEFKVDGIWRIENLVEHDTGDASRCGYTEYYLHRVDNLLAFEIQDNYNKVLTNAKHKGILSS